MASQPSNYVFPTVGKCIYCGSQAGTLSKEHIVPFGLGGVHILPRASCEVCAKITAKFEGWCLQRMFGILRPQYHLPTRRPLQRRTDVRITKTHNDGSVEFSTIGVGEFPYLMLGFIAGEAGILRGASPTDNHNWRGVCDINAEGFRGFGDGKSAVRIAVRTNWVKFSQLLAKMAHGFAVANCGLDSFRPLLLNLILGRVAYPQYLIGGLSEIPAAEPHLYRVTVYDHSANDKNYVMAEVRLFAALGTPAYRIVVGETDGKIVPA